MRTIWKYQLKITDTQDLRLPNKSEIRAIGFDPFGSLCAWVEVDTEETEMWEHIIHIRGTGQTIPNDACRYICHVLEGLLIRHIWESDTFVKVV